MESFTYLLIVLLPIILILYYQKLKSGKPQPPGPKGLPFIGNLHQFDGKFPHIYLFHLSQKYGPVMSLKLGYRPVIVVTSSKVVKEMIKNHDLAVSGRPALTGIRKLSYDGLDVAFSSYSEAWRERRKICTLHLLSVKQLQYFRPIREDEVSRLVKSVVKDASLCKVINLSENITSLTSQIICRMALGKRYGHDIVKNKFFDLLHEGQAMLGAFFVRDFMPLLGWIDNISGLTARLEKNFKVLDVFYQEIIDEHLDANRPKAMNGDIVDLLLEMNRDGSPSMESMNNVKALIMDILFGATDTVSTIMIWTMTVLIKNPTMMEKVQTEIRDLAGNKPLVNEDDIERLPYFKAVIKETFRLYPPAPTLIPRETMETCTISGYEVPPGTMVYINAWAIARDPTDWKDPEKFIPERFLESDIDVRGLDPSVIPFGIGRRGCMAISMGMAVVEIGLANLLYSFDWVVPPGLTEEDIDFDLLPGMTMHKKNALSLVAKHVYPR